MDDISRSEDSSGTRGFFDFLDRGLDSDPDPAEMASVSTQLEALTRRGSWPGRKEDEMELALLFAELE
jgi:hypothetical protein